MVTLFWTLMTLCEIGLAVYCFVRKKRARLEARILCLVQAAAIALYYLLAPRSMDFQWFFSLVYMAGLVLFGGFGLVKYLRKKDDAPFKKSKVIGRALLKSFLWLFVMIPLMIFPPYREPATSGAYKTIESKVYTWTDESRVETLDESGDKRNVTVTFYYTDEAEGKCPLVIFSHGAFGFEKSNYSSYAELVSNGYVVCSISHTYHAFFTEEADGTTKIVNSRFIQDAVDLSNGKMDDEADKKYAVEKEWMNVRLGDANFVLDTIIKEAADGSDEFFKKLDLAHIGYFGHSMGGATAEAMGRQREEIDAVVVLDGTFLGEYNGVSNGKETYGDEEYPKPILNMMSEIHGKANVPGYVNHDVMDNAKIGKNVVIKGTAHMNFTDLPLFSPALSNMLGTGERDSRECIEIVNSSVREWFDCYLKEDGRRTPSIKSEY